MSRPEGPRALGQVVTDERLGTMVRLTVEVPGWTGGRPGQFALLQPEPSRCFLGRALSISDEAGRRAAFLIAPVGEGTEQLCGLRAGDLVWVLGPLGNGFEVDALVESPGRAVLVGGGVGVAPFPFLLRRMAERYREVFVCPTGDEPGSGSAAGPEVVVLLGFRDGAQAAAATPVQEAASIMGEGGLRCRLEVATEDGSRGPAERVTDLLARHLRPGDRVAVCGPPAMTDPVWKVCSGMPDIKVWFSLEANMACGVGSCHGCVIRRSDGSQARVCHEGPVFSGEELCSD